MSKGLKTLVKKRIYETEAVKAFASRMSPLSRRKYLLAKSALAMYGRLGYPEGEKFGQYDNLFAIRILSGGNERFFYCYDTGDVVAVLHAFTKRTKKTPLAEINQALKIRSELFGGVK